MEEGGNALLGDIVERVRSWIPRISSSSSNSYSNREDEGSPKTMSRDFWMPDRSCRMCYDCDSQFTIFNRRHHCRMCGRVFCGKCTLNTISASLDGRGGGGGGAHGAHGTATTHEDGNEKVRVCNYCFKRYCEENGGSDAHNNLALQSSMAPPPPASSSPLMPSPSGGHSSHRSNGLQQGGGAGAASSPVRPALNSQRAFSNGSLIRGSLFADDVLPGGAAGMMEEQLCTDEVKKKQDSEGGGGGGISLFHGEQPPSPYELSRTTKEERSPCLLSDDEEDYDQNGEQSHQDLDYEYGSGIELDLGDFRHPKHNISNDSSLSLVCQTTQSDETFNREELLNNRLAEYHSSRGIGSESLLLQESVTQMCDDIESMDEEPPMYEEALPSQEAPEQPAVDCENSGLIWVPPPPEDDEDEVGTSMVDDDEDEDGAGWLPRSPGSVSSSEYRSKAAMRAIVDGHFRALVAQLLKGEDVQVSIL
jgi:1-phosphatidylinositol-3-phosphate 5-kinase